LNVPKHQSKRKSKGEHTPFFSYKQFIKKQQETREGVKATIKYSGVFSLVQRGGNPPKLKRNRRLLGKKIFFHFLEITRGGIYRKPRGG